MVESRLVKRPWQNSNIFRVITIRQVIDEPIKNHCVAATCDTWTDDNLKRSYLDFSVFWTNDEFKLSHCLLRCKHLPEDSKTSMNIW